MAPVSRSAVSKTRLDVPASGPLGPYDAPPSTMAAQLINNLSTIEEASRPAEKNDLKSLMEEVLEQDANESDDVISKLEQKHKLIYVFTRAVLERLSSDDPFMNQEQLVGQASDALEIFTVVVRELPGVLEYVLPAGVALHSRGQEPLWTWLFPRVLKLLGRRNCEKLTEKIKDFFYISFQAAGGSPQHWNLTSFIFTYLRECVSTTLDRLQSSNILSHAQVVDIVLPSDDMSLFASFVVGNDGSPTSAIDCTYVIRDATEGLSHARNVLSILVDVSMAAAASYDATPAFQDYVGWLLDSFLVSYELHKKWRANTSLNQSCSDACLLPFCSVHALVTSFRDSLSPPLLRKGYTSLSTFCIDLLLDPTQLSEKSIQINFCSSIINLAAGCRRYDSVRRAVSLYLLPVIHATLASGNTFASWMGNNLKIPCIALCRACEADIPTGIDLDVAAICEDSNLNSEFQRLELSIDSPQEPEADNGPPTKRRKLAEGSHLLDQITNNLYKMLGGVQTVEASFSALNEKDQCKAIELLGLVPCGASGYLDATCTESAITNTKCALCEGLPNPDPVERGETTCREVGSDAILLFGALIQSAVFGSVKRPRVLAMLMLKKFAVHYDDSDFIDLEKSTLGQWCLGSLKSSVRELRIAAGRTLPGFLRGSPSDPLTERNIRNTFNFLRSIYEEQSTHLYETCILAWGQLGRNADDYELGIVLLSLVSYLGHKNPLISGVAFNEILRLAKAKKITVERLFSPCWDSLAIEVVKDLLVKPQTTQLMADLLGMSVSEFLVLTQSHTLPWLVLRKQAEVIKRIAEARRMPEESVMCTEPMNLCPILALLLVQNIPDLDSYIMATLKAASAGFKGFDLSELIRIEPASTALCLLKAAGEADDGKKSRIRAALQFLAARAPSVDGNQKRGNPVGAFLELHVLGLVARISEVVNDSRDEHSAKQKERFVKALEELVKVAKSHARVARPQMCACLQSAFAQKELQASAFSAWATMLTNLEDDDVETMLESTFSTIIQRWDSFDERARECVEATLQYLIKHRARLLRNMLVNLPSLSKFPQLADAEKKLSKMRTPTDVGNTFQIFSRRVGHENSGVVFQALVELKSYLQCHQSFLQASAVSEQPDIVVGQLVRAILDTCVKFNNMHHEIAQVSAECIGLIGCLDPNRVENVREQRELVVVSNFSDHDETLDFVLFVLEECLVPAFLSATDTVLQGFLAFVMQDLLEKCNFKEVCGPIIKNGVKGSTATHYTKWLALPTTVQDTLTPFLSSKYSLKEINPVKYEYPIFRPDKAPPGKLYGYWVRTLALDLLQKPGEPSSGIIFMPLRRAIRVKDTSIPSFLLPYLVLNNIIEGTDQNRQELGQELLGILGYQAPAQSEVRTDDIKLCIEVVFRILDYLARWAQERQSNSKYRDLPATTVAVDRVNALIELIPPEVISRRAVECKSYSRALFYWEQHIRHVRDEDNSSKTNTALLERLQDIYTQIDEPDGIEGISAHLHVLDIDQQILAHRKAGRWTAAQSWYEIKLAEEPDNINTQLNLLTCLKESGQHDVLLNYVEGMHTATQTVSNLLPFATEASWATGRWAALEKYTSLVQKSPGEDFNVSIGRSLLALQKKDTNLFTSSIQSLREQIACSLSTSTTSSIAACHDNMLRFHVLTELEMIAGTAKDTSTERTNILETLNRRLEVIGAYLNDKQYLLGIRRAAMQLSSLEFTKEDVASAWLTSARLARKGNAIHQSFNAVLHASELGDESATIEHARLLWKEGHHRKAIQSLQGAIDNNAFISHNKSVNTTSFTGAVAGDQQNFLTARAHLLLAKWLDSAGQTHSSALRTQYQLAAKTHTSSEKGHYYLGRHYNKILESEKALAPELQSEAFLCGETTRLVVENYLRSLSYGTKYVYQTLPRLLTLWLDLGTQVNQPLDPKYGNNREFLKRVSDLRKSHLDNLHSRVQKYVSKMPAYIFYTALPQIVARIAHPNNDVYKYLQQIIFKVVQAHPQQALWTLLAVCTSNQVDRRTRGGTILQALRASKKTETESLDVRAMIKSGERLADQLLLACNAGEFQGNRTIWASLANDLGVSQKACMPNPMAMPVESVLTATLPTLTDNVKTHKAFSRDVVTISSFLDEVMVLSSLQKPRKLTARGSDGKTYGLMCKPKDDLRKDQRLMEFNSMINRSLKRDAESSRRQLYIKTYAVTPLNEECGIIEWVDGLKTIRDILLGLYKAKGIQVNYREIEMFCDEATKSVEKLPFYTEKVLGQFPPILHKWFVQQFPEPSTWFAARLRYTRSCAVMSMVGTILGLGDRHGENILLEEGNGGTFHVDFNCLFDKGLTFVRPERVPFRLTHNMVDAMGIYGYEGPFRKSSELTLKLLRQHEETLMTILEAFVYDPTLDLLKKPEKKKKEGAFVVPQTAQGVLDSIQRKVRGLLAGESVPLGVEGQVDELIKQATNLTYLASMYIGWCSFF